MTYLVNESCINCKHMDCVEVCPVDCFYEGENMLVINPDECIDCGVCEPECPEDAIFADGAMSDKNELDYWMKINTKYSQEWPVVTAITDANLSAQADQWKDVPNRRELLSPTPGEGD